MERLVRLLTVASAHRQLPLNSRNIESTFNLNPLPIRADVPDAALKLGTELRIFNGSADDHVVFAGTESTESGSMNDGYY
ncbi:hypothetical protein E4U55_006051, partial [Claviceps digitariae]